MKIAADHPAESLSLAGAVVILLAHFFASLNDPTTLVALTIVVGAIPGAVTWAVNLFRGRQGNGGTSG